MSPADPAPAAREEPGPPDEPGARDEAPAAEREAVARGAWRSWVPHLLAAAVGVGMLVWAAAALPGLPERVPVHWGVDGRPDRWEPTSFGAVATGPIIALGMTALLAAGSALMPLMAPAPPHPTPWRRIRQAGVVRGTRAALGWVCLLLTVALLPPAVEVLAGDAGRTPWWLMPLGLTVVSLGVFPAMDLSMRAALRRSDAVAAALGQRPTPEELAEEARWTPSGLKRDPEDPQLFPPKREGHGVGMTVNVGHPAGRVLVGAFVALFALGIPAAAWILALAQR